MAPERELFSNVRVFFRFKQPHHDVSRLVPRLFFAKTQFCRPRNLSLGAGSGSPEEASRIEFPTSEVTSGQGSNAACRVLYNVLSMSSQMFSSGPSGTNTGIYTPQGNILALPYGMGDGAHLARTSPNANKMSHSVSLHI